MDFDCCCRDSSGRANPRCTTRALERSILLCSKVASKVLVETISLRTKPCAAATSTRPRFSAINSQPSNFWLFDLPKRRWLADCEQEPLQLTSLLCTVLSPTSPSFRTPRAHGEEKTLMMTTSPKPIKHHCFCFVHLPTAKPVQRTGLQPENAHAPWLARRGEEAHAKPSNLLGGRIRARFITRGKLTAPSAPRQGYKAPSAVGVQCQVTFGMLMLPGECTPR